MPLSLPEFGEPLPVHASPATLQLLARRRSSSAQGLQAPGPNAEDVETLLRLGSRVPDHGKLAPWRFVVLQGAGKAHMVEALRTVASKRPDAEIAQAKLAKLAHPPVSILVVSAVVEGHAIPVWEQQLSAGAVCMTLLIAGEAMGYGANWITDWYATDPEAKAVLGVGESEQVAGFIHFGTPAEAPLERPRPDVAVLTRYAE